MAQLSPYLTFNGNCEDAFNFYKSVFGGDFNSVSRFKDMPSESPIPDDMKEKIMHIALQVSRETFLMGSDSSDLFGLATQPGNNFSISVNTDTEEEATRIFSGLSEGGNIKMPLEKTFWGALFGMFMDKFGIHWMVNYDYNTEQNNH